MPPAQYGAAAVRNVVVVVVVCVPPPPLCPLPRQSSVVFLVVAVLVAANLDDAARGCCCSLIPFYSENVDFMADLCSKYVFRPAVALVETTFIWHSFSFLFRFLVA